MTQKPMTPFFFGTLADEGIYVVLNGAFSHSQLIQCAFNGITWNRQPFETSEEMEHRVIGDLRQMISAAESSSFVESETAIAG